MKREREREKERKREREMFWAEFPSYQKRDGLPIGSPYNL